MGFQAMAGASAPAIAAVPGRAVAAVPVEAAVLSAQAPATRSRPNLARTSSSPGIYIPHPTRTSPRGGLRPLPDVFVAHCRFRLRPGAYVASRTLYTRQPMCTPPPVAAYFCLLTCASPHCRVCHRRIRGLTDALRPTGRCGRHLAAALPPAPELRGAPSADVTSAARVFQQIELRRPLVLQPV